MSDLEQIIVYVCENFCDKYCKYPSIIAAQYQLDKVCEECPLHKLNDLLQIKPKTILNNIYGAFNQEGKN